MRDLSRPFKKGAEFIAVALFIAMFGTFLLQIFARYVLNSPLGWTVEICIILYIWLVFWTSAFLLREHDHVSFNMLFLAAPVRGRRVMAILGLGCIAAAFIAGFPVIVDYVMFMRIEKAPVTRITLDYVYAIFPVFIVALIIRSLISLWRLMRSKTSDREIAAIAGELTQPDLSPSDLVVAKEPKA
ncbi:MULTISPECIES: TRAP transporter small permease [Thalassospira]|uniref:TRAP transporter small permease protein n=1 Tax=Thalassospira aquimaris TaxID=3037796 RepID=A0ABT6G9N1_9PROT|nr:MULTISPECIES: TRAP transporter small permease [Thalassospira]MDG4718775.1 TRAP transporter small permease [Thalassospira sp. FZY0004]